jgi:hypothetical protein
MYHFFDVFMMFKLHYILPAIVASFRIGIYPANGKNKVCTYQTASLSKISRPWAGFCPLSPTNDRLGNTEGYQLMINICARQSVSINATASNEYQAE